MTGPFEPDDPDEATTAAAERASARKLFHGAETLFETRLRVQTLAQRHNLTTAAVGELTALANSDFDLSHTELSKAAKRLAENDRLTADLLAAGIRYDRDHGDD